MIIQPIEKFAASSGLSEMTIACKVFKKSGSPRVQSAKAA